TCALPISRSTPMGGRTQQLPLPRRNMIEPWTEPDHGPSPEVMAEQATLGAAMLGSRQMPDAADILAPADFANPALGIAWAAAVELCREDRPINPQSVADRLSPHDLRAVGGPLGLVRMISPEVAPLLSPAARVRDLATRLRLRIATGRILTAIDEREDALQALEAARQAVDEAGSGVVVADAGATVGEAMDATIDWLEHQPVGANTPGPEIGT